MAKSSDISNAIDDTELSVQIGLDGLSFCTLKRPIQTVTALKHFKFQKSYNPIETLELLKKLFETESALQKKFSRVVVVHNNALSSLVPRALFDKQYMADYLKFNSKILPLDLMAYDTIGANDSVNVYVPYVNINNFIYERFGSFTFKHIASILIETILNIEKYNPISKMYINICDGHFEMVVVDGAKLVLCNTFEQTSKEDFIYYVLFTAEQLNLSPEKLHLIFLGDILEEDALFAIAYKYIRHVAFGSRHDTYTYLEPPKTDHAHFTLINSF